MSAKSDPLGSWVSLVSVREGRIGGDAIWGKPKRRKCACPRDFLEITLSRWLEVISRVKVGVNLCLLKVFENNFIEMK